MGKRELVLILLFVVAGVVVYRVAAPDRGGEGFSFSQWWNRARAEISSDATSAETTLRRTIEVAADVSELQLTDMPSGVQVTGEDRADVDCELVVSSTGPTREAALESAKKVTVRDDRLGSVMTLTMTYPPEARQTVKAILRVPRRLALRVQNGRRITVSHVAGIRLDPAIGETHLTDIGGAITGTHRSGPVTITKAQSVRLSLLNSSATIESVANGVTLDVRNAPSATISRSAGSVEIDATNTAVTIAGHDGPIRVSGSGGRVQVDRPHAETRVEMRSSVVEITIDRAVPVLVQTTEDTLRAFVDDNAGVAIDALAEDGTIQAVEFGLQPEGSEDRQQLKATIGTRAAATIALRNRRSEIVIRKIK